MQTCSDETCDGVARRRGLCWSHYQSWLDADPARQRRIIGDDQARFMAKVAAGPDATDCWRWTATLNGCGYGSFSFGAKTVLAHRAAYELFVGPIPDGLEIDHLCSQRDCVNFRHLEAVTRTENVQRTARRAALRDSDRTHCPAGHELTPDNVKMSAQGTRSCRQCHRDYHKEYQRNWRAVDNG